jgi:photosystem II stability/assembly factor-like uncharacterized protein
MADGLFVATRKGLFRFKASGKGWELCAVQFLGAAVTMVLPDAGGMTYAAVGHGHFGAKLHRSADGGATWEEVGVPAYPPRPEGSPPRMDMFGRVQPDNLDMIWSLERTSPDDPDGLWCGTTPGGLFRSRDRGSTWQMVESLWNAPAREKWMGGGYDSPGIHSICVDPRDSRTVRIGVSSGGIWKTTDAGETWACYGKGMRSDYMPPEQAYDMNAQDPHRLVQCPADPDWLWVQHHNGIFVSKDAGENWRELTHAQPSVFGFAVAVHPHDPKTAWFVPAIKDEKRVACDARVCVSRTRDGGETFDVLTNGLPQHNAYDIAYRHALDIDEEGDGLAFGTTTGSLWTSRNGGESWQSFSNHLPPVYAVRFLK